MINGNEPAFPRVASVGYLRTDDPDARFWERQEAGMSLREWFAGMAMQGLLAEPGRNIHKTHIAVAQEAAGFADALIAELNKEEKK